MMLRDEQGQVVALTALAMVLLVGMAALVLDVGSWFRAQRDLQQIADAAALAGAQALPEDPGAAVSLALEYAERNGGTLSANDVRIESASRPSDQIFVEARGTAPGFFSRVFGISAVDVGARAAARAQPVGAPRYAAPIVVDEAHPLLRCTPLPCFGEPTTVTLADLHDPRGAEAAGSFGIVDLAGVVGAPGASTLADWVRNGYDGALTTGEYETAPGGTFNSAPFREAVAERIGTELLLPVYRTITGSGAKARYTIVGWVGFKVTSFTADGKTGTLSGHFTRVTWDGEEGSAATPDFGVRTVSLVR